MQCLIGSQVLCEFWDDDDYHSDDYHSGNYDLGFIDELNHTPEARPGKYGCTHNQDKYFDNCRIYQHSDYWISNAKGNLVFPDGLLVNVFFDVDCDFTECVTNGGGFEQRHHGGGIEVPFNFDTAKYVQVTGLEEGYSR